ncbi:MAG: NUDIX hydrolase [Micrococcus sp.]|nr:NUDIX hydrolase [Micrococcus sp.]
MSLDAPQLLLTDLHDRHERAPVLDSERAFEGRVWDVRRDTVDLGESQVVREYVAHTGAVAILAVRTDRGTPEIFVIQQYRHPIGAHDWEIPAGLLDVEGEDPQVTAARELAEEADLVAEQWEVLLRHTPSPGGLDEEITMYLATGLSDVPADERHERTDEEAGMPSGWVSLPVAVEAVLAGQVRNGPLMLAVLALHTRLRGA